MLLPEKNNPVTPLKRGRSFLRIATHKHRKHTRQTKKPSISSHLIYFWTLRSSIVYPIRPQPRMNRHSHNTDTIYSGNRPDLPRIRYPQGIDRFFQNHPSVARKAYPNDRSILSGYLHRTMLVRHNKSSQDKRYPLFLPVRFLPLYNRTMPSFVKIAGGPHSVNWLSK